MMWAQLLLCITPSRKLAEGKGCMQWGNGLDDLPTKEIAKASLEARGAIILVGSLEEAFAVSNFLVS